MNTQKKHNGAFETCQLCVSQVARNGSGYTVEIRRLHSVAIQRQARNSAMRDMGMVKVRGTLGGTYWE